jgi:hypothetical protein
MLRSRLARAARFVDTGAGAPFQNTCRQGPASWRLLPRNSSPVPQTRAVGSDAQLIKPSAIGSGNASQIGGTGMGGPAMYLGTD